jgi:hypothetical protein
MTTVTVKAKVKFLGQEKTIETEVNLCKYYKLTEKQIEQEGREAMAKHIRAAALGCFENIEISIEG